MWGLAVFMRKILQSTIQYEVGRSGEPIMPTLQERIEQRRRRRRMHWPRLFMVVALLLAFGAGAWAGAGYVWGKVSPGASTAAHDALADKKKLNILILGINERQHDKGRSNVTGLLTVDTETNQMTLLSVPRDSRVKIPGCEWNKIGHAYAYGGPELARRTAAELLGVPIDYYFGVNMAGFIKAIDTIGGIDLNVEKRMYYYDPYDAGEVDNDGLIDLRAGQQHLDGNTALQYVRFRHDEMGDIGRIERQQKFLTALLNQAATPRTIAQIPEIVQALSKTVITDIPTAKLLLLGKAANAAAKGGIVTTLATGKPVYIDGISYWLPDISAIRAQAAQQSGLQQGADFQESVRKQCAEYKAALAGLKVTDS